MAINFSANQTLVGFGANGNNNNYCAGFSLAAVLVALNTDAYRPVNLNLNTLPPLLDVQAFRLLVANQNNYTQGLCTYQAIQNVQNDTNLYVGDRYLFLLGSMFLGSSTRMSFPSAVCTVIKSALPNLLVTANMNVNILTTALNNLCQNYFQPWVGQIDTGVVITAESEQIDNLGPNYNVVNVMNNYTTLPMAGEYNLMVVNDAAHMIAADYNSIYDPGTGIVYTTIVFNQNGSITGTDANNNTQTWTPSGLWLSLT
jgi:hypothetical protein